MKLNTKTLGGLVCGLALVGLPARANLIQVSSPGALGNSSAFSWGGPGWNTLPSGSTFTSGGISVDVSGPGSNIIQTVQGLAADDTGYTWNGNFNVGDSVIYNGVTYFGYQPGGLSLHFLNPVVGAGVFVQQNWSGSPGFGAEISAFDVNNVLLGTYSFTGIAGQSADGTAVFAGFLSSLANISTIVIDTDSHDFAIGALSVNVPDSGSTVALLGLGFAGLCMFRKRQ